MAGLRSRRGFVTSRTRTTNSVDASRPQWPDLRLRTSHGPPGPHKAPSTTCAMWYRGSTPANLGPRSSATTCRHPDQERTNSAAHQAIAFVAAGQKRQGSRTAKRQRACRPPSPTMRQQRALLIWCGRTFPLQSNRSDRLTNEAQTHLTVRIYRRSCPPNSVKATAKVLDRTFHVMRHRKMSRRAGANIVAGQRGYTAAPSTLSGVWSVTSGQRSTPAAP